MRGHIAHKGTRLDVYSDSIPVLEESAAELVASQILAVEDR